MTQRFIFNVAKTHFYVANIFLDVANRPMGNVYIGRPGASTPLLLSKSGRPANGAGWDGYFGAGFRMETHLRG
jgi:hypothetical protein